MEKPRITFGMIVLNGEPFISYNLQALYPFAHQIIVVEGASPKAAHVATKSGHSLDSTLLTLRRFKASADPDNKLTIVTAEDDGYPNGFWPGEKDEQSRAYARRATGDWLWQIDVDEFYQEEDMNAICEYLVSHPETTCLTFDAYHFWGGFDYLLEGGLFMSHRLAGEPGGAIRRVLKWGRGYKYTTHRPPTIHDNLDHNITNRCKVNFTALLGGDCGRIFHYTNVFPVQVIPKGQYYSGLDQKTGSTQKRRFESFLEPRTLRNSIRIYDHYGTFNWLKRFDGKHPEAILMLKDEIANATLSIEMRTTTDIERILDTPRYLILTRCLWFLERLRTGIWGITDPIVLPIKRRGRRLVGSFRANTRYRNDVAKRSNGLTKNDG